MTGRWDALTCEFRDHHKHPLNILLHLVTTPTAIFAAATIVAHFAGAQAVWTAVTLWALALAVTVPTSHWVLTAVSLAGIASMAVAAADAMVGHMLILFAAAYLGQDVAHWVTCEPTFQNSYLGKRPGWVYTFLDHTHHLIPLCFVSYLEMMKVMDLV